MQRTALSGTPGGLCASERAVGRHLHGPRGALGRRGFPGPAQTRRPKETGPGPLPLELLEALLEVLMESKITKDCQTRKKNKCSLPQVIINYLWGLFVLVSVFSLEVSCFRLFQRPPSSHWKVKVMGI